jgi:hypothetical protein
MMQYENQRWIEHLWVIRIFFQKLWLLI